VGVFPSSPERNNKPTKSERNKKWHWNQTTRDTLAQLQMLLLTSQLSHFSHHKNASIAAIKTKKTMRNPNTRGTRSRECRPRRSDFYKAVGLKVREKIIKIGIFWVVRCLKKPYVFFRIHSASLSCCVSKKLRYNTRCCFFFIL